MDGKKSDTLVPAQGAGQKKKKRKGERKELENHQARTINGSGEDGEKTEKGRQKDTSPGCVTITEDKRLYKVTRRPALRSERE